MKVNITMIITIIVGIMIMAGIIVVSYGIKLWFYKTLLGVIFH